MAIWRVQTAAGPRLARGSVEGGPVELLEGTIDMLLANGSLDAKAAGPLPAGSVVMAPVDGQEVWAAGVTYAASRSARNDESKGTHDFYDLVYDAERPELFFKAAPGRVRGPGGLIGVRQDSGWDVPEPELALVISATGKIVGYTVGNDVSSRSIEGENPLYLPQAKVYRGSCALGPCIVPVAEAPPAEEMEIHAHHLPPRRHGVRRLDAGRPAQAPAHGARDVAVPRAGVPGRRGAADRHVRDSRARVHAARG